MELGTKGIFTSSVKLAALEPTKKNTIVVRATSGLESMLVKSGYKNPEYRGQLSLDLTPPVIQDVAHKYNKVAIATGQFQQGKDIINAGVMADKDLAEFGAESLRVIEYYYRCKAGKMGTYDEKTETAYIPMKEIFAMVGQTEPKQRQRYRKKFFQDLLVAAMPTWYITINGLPAGAGSFVVWERIPKGDIVSMHIRDHIRQLFLKSQRYSDDRKLLLDNFDFMVAHHLESRYTINHNNQTDTQNIISVESLLEAVAKNLPSEEQAAKHLMKLIGQRIIKALEAAKKAGVITYWTFCGEKKTPYTQEQIDKCYKNYNDFKKAYILFELAIGETEGFQNYHERERQIYEDNKERNKKRKAKK